MKFSFRIWPGVADDLAERASGIGALAEPARRALYLYVVSQPDPVSRDQAAEGAGLARHTAKFHLDKLVEEGLLETDFRRLSGRQGPGAGRPSKLYRRAAREVQISLPERRYDLAGQILARAVEDAVREERPVLETLEGAAAKAGRELAELADSAKVATGHPATIPSDPDLDPADPDLDATDLGLVAAILATQGYEPRVKGDAVVLANCPFHALAQTHTKLVCGMNLGLITALLDALGQSDVQATLDPAPGRCCVTLAASR